MGHEFSRAVVAGALAAFVVLPGCGGDDAADELPAVLDNARDLVAETPLDSVAGDGADDDPSSAATAGSATDSVGIAPDELPAPDPSTFEGRIRVVNLWVGDADGTRDIDVWGRRTFTTGPILLAENVTFGTASEYFSAPPGYSLVIVGAGAGPDGDELAGLFSAAEGEQHTTVFTNLDDNGTATAATLWERGAEQAPESPDAGDGLVVLFAPNTRAFSDELVASVGGDSFFVGDGSSACRPQRVEEGGFAPSVLGGTQRVELELPPGRAAISLHPWFSPDECDQPSVLDIEVDVVAGGVTMLLVYSPDGSSIDVLELSVD